MGLRGGGGILWTAWVPSLSCKQAQNSGDSAKKSEQKNSDGVEGGGGDFIDSLGSPTLMLTGPK